MNSHALAVLEFPRVLALVAGRATRARRGARAGAAPSTDRAWIEREHARVAAMRALVERASAGTPSRCPTSPRRSRGSASKAPSWTARRAAGRRARCCVRRAARATRCATTAAPPWSIAVLAPARRPARSSRRRPTRSRSSARSATTARCATTHRRRCAASAASCARRRGSWCASSSARWQRLEAHHQRERLLRHGAQRPLRDPRAPRGARGRWAASCTTASQTGATVFVEPPAAIEFGNRIRELEARGAARRSSASCASSPTAAPASRARSARRSTRSSELDSLYARARYARGVRLRAGDCCAPARRVRASWTARHPLLLAQLARGAWCRSTSRWTPGERTLLVSGPNTGGKTVLLKAIGLLSRDGAERDSRAGRRGEPRSPVFDDVFADVGDEQSIEASLSTFSAHLKNLAEILRLATARLARAHRRAGIGHRSRRRARRSAGAILEELTRRGTMTIATTHLGALKELATEVHGVVNASLQFDAVAARADLPADQGRPGPLVRHQHRAAAAAARSASSTRAEERMPQQRARHRRAARASSSEREAELAEREQLRRRAIAEDARARRRTVRRARAERARARARVEKQARAGGARATCSRRAPRSTARSASCKQAAGRRRSTSRRARRAARRGAGRGGRARSSTGSTARRRNVAPQTRAARAGRSRAAEPPREGDTVEVGTLGGKRRARARAARDRGAWSRWGRSS